MQISERNRTKLDRHILTTDKTERRQIQSSPRPKNFRRISWNQQPRKTAPMSAKESHILCNTELLRYLLSRTLSNTFVPPLFEQGLSVLSTSFGRPFNLRTRPQSILLSSRKSSRIHNSKNSPRPIPAKYPVRILRKLLLSLQPASWLPKSINRGIQKNTPYHLDTKWPKHPASSPTGNPRIIPRHLEHTGICHSKTRRHLSRMR